MQWKMSENSLFAHLLRAPWWISLAVAFLVGSAARYFLPEKYSIFGLSLAFPFLAIGVVTAWRQFSAPSAARIEATRAAVAAMNWRDFSAKLQQALEKDGYTVSRASGAADFKVVKAGRVLLVCAKRWKAANLGVEPLRELEAAREAQEVHAAMYVATGELSDNAQRFAREHRIELIQGAELARLLRL